MQKINGHENSIYGYRQRGNMFELFRGHQSYRLFNSMASMKGAVAKLVSAAESTTPKECMNCNVVFASWGAGNRLCSKCRIKTEGMD